MPNREPRECQDCGDEIPSNERRRRCTNCGFLVCGWCMNHVHVLGVPYTTADCAPPVNGEVAS